MIRFNISWAILYMKLSKMTFRWIFGKPKSTATVKAIDCLPPIGPVTSQILKYDL